MSAAFMAKLPFWMLVLLWTGYVLTLAVAADLEYSDLEQMGVSCFPQDTCNRKTRPSFENRSCECDESCNEFKDCCIDAPYIQQTNTQRLAQEVECLEVESDAVYAVTMCPVNYQGPENIRSKCEDFDDISEPLAMAPTTDVTSNTTYKNNYCAQCNGAEAKNLQSWQISIDCERLPDSALNSIVDASYVEENLQLVSSEANNDNWGFYYPKTANQPSAKSEFYPCNFRFNLSDSLRPFVRSCRPQLVSSCPASWRRNAVRRQCEAYMAVVYIQLKFYRNPHCALCNSAHIERRLCQLPGSSVADRGKKPALSFTLLMDVNMSDGNRVGEVRDSRCPKKQMWDPFAKKCRPLVCAIPGYQIRRGQCVRP